MKHITKSSFAKRALLLLAALLPLGAAVYAQTTVTSNSVWVGNSNLTNGNTYGDNNFLKYTGTTTREINLNQQINADNQWPGTFDFTAATNYLSMQIGANKTGKILVYYKPQVTETRTYTIANIGPWGGYAEGQRIENENELVFNAWNCFALSVGYQITGLSQVEVEFGAGFTCPVRVNVIYTDNTDSGSEYVPVYENGTNYIYRVNADPTKTINAVVIQSNAAGRAKVLRAATTHVVSAQPHLYTGNDYNSKTEVSGATASVDANGTGILSYNYTTGGANENFFINGGYIGAVAVTAGQIASSTSLPDDIQTITDYKVYYSQGKQLWNQTRVGSDKVWWYNRAPINSNPGKTVWVNGGEPYITGEDDARCNTNIVDANTALGFKLAANKTFRIQITCHSDNLNAAQLLKTGDVLENIGSNYVTGGYVTEIKGPGGADSDTRLVTFDVTTGSNAQTFWINPAQAVNIGAVQVLVDNTYGNRNVKTTRTNDNTHQIKDAFKTGQTRITLLTGANREKKSQVQIPDADNTNRDLREDLVNILPSGAPLYKVGSNETYGYLFGPSMVYNDIAYPSEKTVLLNSGNAFGMSKLPKGSRVKVSFIANAGDGITLKLGEDLNSATTLTTKTLESNATADLVYVHTGNEDFLWITNASSNPANYVYISEITVEVPEDVDTKAITDDFIWRVDESTTLSWRGKFEQQYLFNYGNEKTASTQSMIVDGQSVHYLDFTTDSEEKINFRIDDDAAGEIRIYYKSGDVSLRRGTSYTAIDNSTVPGSASARNSRENSTVDGTTDYYRCYFSATDPRYYSVTGAEISAIEVFIYKNETAPTLNVIDRNVSLWVEEGAETTINNGAAEMVINKNSLIDDQGLSLFEGADVAMNTTQSLADKKGKTHGTILLSSDLTSENAQSVTYRFKGGATYTVRIYYGKSQDSGVLRLKYNQKGTLTVSTVGGGSYNFENGAVASNDFWNAQDGGNFSASLGYREAVYNLESVLPDEYGEITVSCGGTMIYYAGAEVEVNKARIDFDVYDGVFTGKHEGKLLVYCSDNGTITSFKVPKAVYHAAGALENDEGTDLTNSPTRVDREMNFWNVEGDEKSSNGRIGSANGTLSFGAEGTSYVVTGFEDTDIDRLYKITYSYNGVSDYYYLWFVNFLKVGWWTGRDAKLIVDSDKSYLDPNNIFVGEFYVSSASMGTLYFEAQQPDMFEGVSYKYTNDNNGISTKSRSVSTSDMNGDNSNAINLSYPPEANVSKWAGGNVSKTVEVTFKRKNYTERVYSDATNYTERNKKWPDITMKFTFHFVPAPKVALVSTDYSLTTPKTTVRIDAANASNQLYYTTDGNMPDGNSYTATNGQTIQATRGTVYYAAEKVNTQSWSGRKGSFYPNNPYTTDMNPAISSYDVMSSSNEFYAVSKICEAPLIDLKVDYLNMTGAKLEHATNYAGAVSTGSTAIIGSGGYVYDYPVNTSKANRQMTVKFGNSGVKALRSDGYDTGSGKTTGFTNVGVSWTKIGELETPYDEHLDHAQYGANHTDEVRGDNDGSQNGNPHTECNGGIGGMYTENGGMFLTPVTGDFFRFEPQYDGVVTLWMRQNGAAQNDEYRGNITRRPVYVMDENGVIMKRSTIKPSTENYFGINGVYAEIDEIRSQMRQDFRVDWNAGLKSWMQNYDGSQSKALPDINKAVYKLYNYWFGLPFYQRKNADKHATKLWNNTNTLVREGELDCADSWVSRTAKVQSVQCPYNSIYYRSEYLGKANGYMDFTSNGVEKSLTFITSRTKNGDDWSDNTRDVWGDAQMALYGWELPTYNIVRYRIPVRAGKTYYIGGRGTKNGFVATKFEPLPANYSSADYVSTDNYNIKETDYTCTKVTTGGSKAGDAYSESAALASYKSDNPGYVGAPSESNYRCVRMWEWSNYNNNIEFTNADLVGKTVDARLMQRRFEKNKWYGILLPFSVSETQLKEVFGNDVKVIYLDPFDNTVENNNRVKSVVTSAVCDKTMGDPNSYKTLKFTHHYYQMLYANTPAFICPSQPVAAGDAVFRHVNFTDDNTGNNTYQTRYGKTGFKNIGYKIGESGNYEYFVTGSYYRTERNSTDGKIYYQENRDNSNNVTYAQSLYDDYTDMYYLDNFMDGAEGENQAIVYHATGGVGIGPNRCWIEVRPKAGYTPAPREHAPLITSVGFMEFDDEFEDYQESGIADIIADENSEMMYNDDNVYDSLGRIVAKGSTDGLRTGVYLFKGKKVFVK